MMGNWNGPLTQNWSKVPWILSELLFKRKLAQRYVDQLDPRGGTTATGSVARRAFSNDSNFIECKMSVVGIQHKDPLLKVHTQLSAILRIFNSDRRIKTEEFGNLCRNTSQLILDSFPWANISPTLHKLLAHSEEILRDINFRYGLKCFSKEASEAFNKLIRKTQNILQESFLLMTT